MRIITYYWLYDFFFLVLGYPFLFFPLCVFLFPLYFLIQIANPEDWDKLPDPRKHFVEFFGTDEM
jgi:hypothetical protein